ncbi:MAG: DnaB-like helicase N-terminal domain-containing protein, partial [Parvularculaceae bacterium]
MADGPNIASSNPNKQGADERIPLSLEAEQAILGAILFDNEVYYRVSSYLKAEHFYDPVHQLIYDACGRLVGSGRVAAPTIVESHLSSSHGFV